MVGPSVMGTNGTVVVGLGLGPPHHADPDTSNLILVLEVKQVQVWLVLRWKNTRDLQVRRRKNSA